jgi:pyruvate formate lyase activating enzyme
MDIKVPLEKYSQLVPKISSKLKTYNSKPQFKTQNLPPNYKKNIKNSIKIILNQSPNYEFRSTLIKGWHDENHVIKMAQMINGAKKYFLQKFEPKKNLLNPEFKKYKPFSMEEMKEFASIAKKYVRDCEIRGY